MYALLILHILFKCLMGHHSGHLNGHIVPKTIRSLNGEEMPEISVYFLLKFRLFESKLFNHAQFAQFAKYLVNVVLCHTNQSLLLIC